MTTESLLTAAVDDPATGDTYETVRTFESLGVIEPLTKVLADQGITTAFPIQALTIADAVAGRDVCGKAKTGSGKTLAFGLPLLQRTLAGKPAGEPVPGRPARPAALVLLPTRELAVQVHDVLAPLAKAVGLRVAAVYGGADVDRQVAKLRKGVEVVIATPGRLIDLGERGELSVADVEVLVLDEADRMADMGFMPQVEWVLRRARATAPDAAVLGHPGRGRRPPGDALPHDPVLHEVASQYPDRGGHGAPVPAGPPDGQGEGGGSHLPAQDKVLVFVRTKRGADRLVEQLGQGGRQVGSDPRRPASGEPRAGAGRLLLGEAARAGGHRRGRPRPAHRRRRRGDPLRPARGPQGLPPPVRADRQGRLDRRRGHAGLVEPGGRGRGHPAPARAAVPIVEVFSNDPRLGDLASWVPSPDESVL